MMTPRSWLLCSFFVLASSYPRSIPLGVFLNDQECSSRDGRRKLQHIVDFVKDKRNRDPSSVFKFNNQTGVDKCRESEQDFPSDAWTIMRHVCDRLKEGFFMILANGDATTDPAYRSLAENMKVPFVNWNLPPSMPIGERSRFEISVRPPTAELIADLIIDKGWEKITYIHDGDGTGGVNLEQIFYHLKNPPDCSLALRDTTDARSHSVNAELIQLPKEPSDFGAFWDAFHRARFNDSTNQMYRVVMDVSNSARQDKLLMALKRSEFTFPKRFHYVVANYDFTPEQIETFSDIYVNITGFQLINYEDQDFWRFQQEYRKYLRGKPNVKSHEVDMEISAEEAFVHDSLIVAFKVLERTLKANDELFNAAFKAYQDHIYNYNEKGIYCFPSQDLKYKMDPKSRQFRPFQFGDEISKSLKKVNLDRDEVLTGYVGFNKKKGIREEFTVIVKDLTYSPNSAYSSLTKHIWHQCTGFSKNQSISTYTRQAKDEVKSRTIIITTVLTKPFIMWKRDADKLEGNDRFEGYCVDLMKLMKASLAPTEDFLYAIKIVDDGAYGSPTNNGTWNGMIGELLSGKAHMAVAPLTINRARERVVDFSKPFMTTGISIMIKKPDKQEFSVFSFMQPLSTEIWMYIIFAYVGVSVVIFLVSRFSPYEWRVEEMSNGSFTISNDFSVYNCLWFTLAAFMQQGTDILPRSVSGRIASSAWWFFTMIMISSYTANLAAFLTSEKLQASIESVEDLAKQTKIKYGIQGGGSTAAFFEFSTVQMYQRMWQYMSSQVPSVFTKNYAEGIKRVRESKGRYAFLLEQTANEYANTRKPCDTMMVGQKLNSVGYGVATPFGSDLKNKINLAILELQERGELKKLENKWWYDRGQCEQGISDSQSASLNLSKVAGIFYILIGGMIAAMVAALGELLYRSRIEARKGKRSLGTSMKAQLELSLKGDGVAPVRPSEEEAAVSKPMLQTENDNNLLTVKGAPQISVTEGGEEELLRGAYNTAV